MSTIPPVFQSRPDLISPTGHVKVWFIQPLGMMTFADGHFSTEDAEFVVGDAWRRTLGFTRSFGFEGYQFVHHWAEMKSYDAQARQVLVRWGHEIRADIRDVTIILAPHTKPVIKMGAQVGTTLLRMAGVPMQIEYDYAKVAERLDLELLRAA